MNDFHTQMMKDKELLEISMKESIRQKNERTTPQKQFQQNYDNLMGRVSCDGNGEHPLVYYTLNKNEATCDYCNMKLTKNNG